MINKTAQVLLTLDGNCAYFSYVSRHPLQKVFGSAFGFAWLEWQPSAFLSGANFAIAYIAFDVEVCFDELRFVLTRMTEALMLY